MSNELNELDLYSMLKTATYNSMNNLNCIKLAKVEAVNDDQTINTTIQYKKKLKTGEIRNYPLLTSVPYIVLQGGSTYIDMPIKVGDYCLLMFSDFEIETWFNTGNVAEPKHKRLHSITDGFALVGLNRPTAPREKDGVKVRIVGQSGSAATLAASRVGDEIKVIIPPGGVVIGVAGQATPVFNLDIVTYDGIITTGSDDVEIT